MSECCKRWIDDFNTANDKIKQLSDKNKKLQQELNLAHVIIRLAEILIQPTDYNGPVLEGNRIFRDILMMSVRNYCSTYNLKYNIKYE